VSNRFQMKRGFAGMPNDASTALTSLNGWRRIGRVPNRNSMQDVTTKKRWSDLTGRQRAAVLVAASVELALTATALVDLARRPGTQVRGPKARWALGCFVQPVGPVAYLVFGRHMTSR